MSNLPFLVRNTLDGFSDGAQKLYLDLLDRYQGWNDRKGELRAFHEAHVYEERVGGLIAHILRHGPLLDISRLPDPSVVDPDYKGQVERFFADRYKNMKVQP